MCALILLHTLGLSLFSLALSLHLMCSLETFQLPTLALFPDYRFPVHHHSRALDSLPLALAPRPSHFVLVWEPQDSSVPATQKPASVGPVLDFVHSLPPSPGYLDRPVSNVDCSLMFSLPDNLSYRMQMCVYIYYGVCIGYVCIIGCTNTLI